MLDNDAGPTLCACCSIKQINSLIGFTSANLIRVFKRQFNQFFLTSQYWMFLRNDKLPAVFGKRYDKVKRCFNGKQNRIRIHGKQDLICRIATIFSGRNYSDTRWDEPCRLSI